jgi:large subunit ribosomal protein L15
MELHTLTSVPGARKRKRRRVGRGPGSGNGKTAGKGHKGQQARTGYSLHPGFEGGQMPLHRRLPKRGFNHQDRRPQGVVNVDTLDRAFDAGAVITADAIVEAGLADAVRGGIKVLGRGEITKKLDVRVQSISDTAKQKIEAAGGSVTLEAAPTAVPSDAQPRNEE